MKKIVLIAALIIGLKASGHTLIVGSHQSFSSIRQAVNAAQFGDTVLIKKGTYYTSNILINKSITLIGENYPVLNGAGKYEIVTISGQHIVIKGIHFTNSGYSGIDDFAAIKIENARNITIENNRITNAFFGIHVANSNYCTIRNNALIGIPKTEQNTGNGIHLWKCDHALIQNNKVNGHRDGIYFEFVTESLIKNNISEGNIRYGLHFMFANHDTYIGNTFKNNGAGVAVMFSHHVIMQRNQFTQNWGGSSYGLLLKEISDGKIEHNTFYQNTIGILMDGTNRLQVFENTFKENGWAAKVQANCNDNNVHHNNFLSNTFDIATNGTLVLNKFSNNYWDKYEGYDIDKNGFGDVPYHPVSLYSMIIEENPNSLMLLRSFMVSLLDKVEKAIPSFTPENLLDEQPLMKALQL